LTIQPPRHLSSNKKTRAGSEKPFSSGLTGLRPDESTGRPEPTGASSPPHNGPPKGGTTNFSESVPPKGGTTNFSESVPPKGGTANSGGTANFSAQIGREVILVRFIRLCSSILAAPMPLESAALIVNRISEIVRVDRAVLVRLTGGHAITAVTGGGVAAQDSSFADAVEAVRKKYRKYHEPVVVPPLTKNGEESSSGHQVASPHVRKVQQAMSGTSILWLPLWLTRDTKIPPEYALWLERWHGVSWEKADIELLQHAAVFLGHGLVRPQSAISQSRNRLIRIAAGLMILIFLALPVTSSVTAPMRVIPDRPYHIFAPMDGILKELRVQPGQRVKKDDILFKYDDRVLEKRLDEAYRNVAVARAKLAKLEGAAHRDPQARSELPVQQLEVERAEADVEFFKNQLSRADVRTAKPGVIVLDDPDALVGAAIQTGQMVLSVADPCLTKLRIMVPASDVGFIKEGSQVKVSLDSDPLNSLPAVITRIGFDVKLSEEQVPSLLAEAVWSDADKAAHKVQPGQKGVTKIFGGTTFLGIQILRKPLIALRTFTGI